MTRRYLLFIIFLLVAVIQLYVSAKMIFDRKGTLTNGKTFKFITAPVDPNDPFRGKYINLSFRENLFPLNENETWNENEDVYVQLTIGPNGYAKIVAIHKQPPTSDPHYILAKTGDIIQEKGEKKIEVVYPFDRYYMEESKAYEAEQIYRESQNDPSQTTYALVSVKDGMAVLKDVMINDISIRQKVTQRKETGQ